MYLHSTGITRRWLRKNEELLCLIICGIWVRVWRALKAINMRYIFQNTTVRAMYIVCLFLSLYSYEKICMFTVWLTFFSVTGELGSPRRHAWTLLQCCLCTDRARPAETGHENPTKGWMLGHFEAFFKYSVGYITSDNSKYSFDNYEIIK